MLRRVFIAEFRDRAVAASLKHVNVALKHQQEYKFRDRAVAASLKLQTPPLEYLTLPNSATARSRPH